MLLLLLKAIIYSDLPLYAFHLELLEEKQRVIMGCYTARWRRLVLQLCIAAFGTNFSNMDKFSKAIILYFFIQYFYLKN